ncbi:phage/plasmid primase, P4 family [Streptomyces europaeiscabiei]|uniref:phage/plasmid primase, P4 family n=1 Tax=Streptomyces europaeiscabiei TaxID=146819 RepID=UPI0029B57797|nr:phage/plasmid primase, P4 family [Streptomyces europaeiscabiei]MDX3860047.1 phage/plasmid primase, P4 family [Streptomyces europaeiscabiei]
MSTSDKPEPRDKYAPKPGAGLSPEHQSLLLDSAITQDVIDASGIASTRKGVSFPWNDGTAATLWQHRPDEPFTNADGDLVKYLFPKGAKVPLNRLRDGDTYTRVIIAEGTKQSWAVLSHAPAEYAVYGLSGCWGYKHADLTAFYGREVFLLFDADFSSNVDVYAAAEQFAKQLKKHGAKAVQFVSTTGDGKQGVDDVLAGFPESKRAEMLRLWISQATDKLGKRPAAKAPTEEASKYFRTRSKPIALQPKDAADDLLAAQPAALTREGNVALYANGVYRVDDAAVLSWTVRTFGNYFTPSIHTTVNMFLKGLLAGTVLPERATDPLLNCPNGMVDLRTGELLPHDPAHLSYVQVTTDYRPEQATPEYDRWIREALRQDGATEADLDALVDDIEETAGTMLDPTRTPSKALFLFGPSRSGKSTFLRLLKAVAGAANTSAVTLHNMARDQFAVANLYGRMLNVAADLSNEHVNDLSNFKMITGEDAIQANRKYGGQFTFTNQALMAFSANELPTVSEASRAYAERMKPFNFPNSFAGREDKSLEDKLLAELPGILARWVRAYGRFLARNGYAATDKATQMDFEAKSDRVVQFFQDMCTLTPASYQQKLADELCTGRREVAQAFNAWAERNGSSKMGERAFFQRLAKIDGVTEVAYGPKGNKRAFNVVVASADDDSWQDEPQPEQQDAAEAVLTAAEAVVLGHQDYLFRVPAGVGCAIGRATARKAASLTADFDAADEQPPAGTDPWADGLGLDDYAA